MKTLISATALFAAAAGAPALAQQGPDDPPWNGADAYHDPERMAESRRAVQRDNGGMRFLFVGADRLELRHSDNEETLLWDGDVWYGGDIHRIWFKSEGELALREGETEEAGLEALYSRAISPYFDLQAGLAYDFEGDEGFAVLGVQGLAPYWFEVDAALQLSEDGDLSAGGEVEYDIKLTQRLILQPRAEAELDVEDGLEEVQAGLRLRYDIRRKFSPYVGVEWTGLYGHAADEARLAGEPEDDTAFVAGVKFWF